MAIATREAATARPTVPRPERQTPVQPASDTVLHDVPTVAQHPPKVPARHPDYEAPVNLWPLFLFLLFVFLTVDVAFAWAAIRAATGS